MIQHWFWLDALCNSRPCIRKPQPKFAYDLLSITSVLLHVTKPLIYLITSNKRRLCICVFVAQMLSCNCISLSYWTTIHSKHYCWRYSYVPRWMSLGDTKYRFQITTNKMQHFFFIYLFISTDVLHVSGGSSAHHQEYIPVHTASGIVNQYCCLLLSWMYVQLCAPDDGRRSRLKNVERL